MKLETLKDIEPFGASRKGYLLLRDDVKTLAIKWVKKMRKEGTDSEEFEEFHNISEEDLK